MDDYISREAAMSMPLANGQYDHEHANEHFILGLESYKEWLEYVPAADVRLVVHGHWIAHQSGRWVYAKCSECSTVHDTPSPLCPSCGAYMRKKDDAGGKTTIPGGENG